MSLTASVLALSLLPLAAPATSSVPAAVLSAAATVGRPIAPETTEPDDPDHAQTRGLEGGSAPIHDRAAAYFSENLYDAQLTHLVRVAAWGSANVVGGAALMGGSAAVTAAGIESAPELFGFGAQASAWGAINLAIVGVGYFFLDGVTTDLNEALEAEDGWRTTLLVNEVLNVGYVIAGLGMVALGMLPIPLAAQLRGHGMGIVMQGAGLLLLDGLALLEAYDRKEKLDRFREVPAHREAMSPGEE
jgi:hypothetical protein